MWSEWIVWFDRYMDTSAQSHYQTRGYMPNSSYRTTSNHLEYKLTKYKKAIKFIDCVNDYITHPWIRRGLGNLMFIRASTIGVGLQNDLIPIFNMPLPHFEHT